MAHNTDITLRNSIIYSVYVRAHTKEGTFNAVTGDLDRIKALGTDIIWFMPIHPIGIKGKKGSLGCPYANRDYRDVNPAYGTIDDFKKLVDEIHSRGMKCIIDVVYNHSSPDAVLVSEHPEFYYRKSDGNFGNKTADWTDVIDLDYSNRGLWDYQIESLKFWAGIVDGFRCDVASLIPLEFWLRAREEVEKVRPGCIWLAESVHCSFNLFNRMQGINAVPDGELFGAFDMEYDYDIREVFDSYLAGSCSLSNYTAMLNMQEVAYPGNYIKMRCLENHDQLRFASRLGNEFSLENFNAMLYFMKGSTMLYAGEEYQCTHQPSLFEQEVFPRDAEKDISKELSSLAAMKKAYLDADDVMLCSADDKNDIAVMQRVNSRSKKLGVFSLKGKTAEIKTDFPDGRYRDCVSGDDAEIINGTLKSAGKPIIIVCK